MLTDCNKPNFDYEFTKMPEPNIHLQDDAIFYPKNDLFPSQIWGIYDLCGRMVPAAALSNAKVNLERGQEWVVKSQRNTQWLPEIECAIYGGFIGLHYGHTLLEFLPRLWYLREKFGPSVKIIVHCGFDLAAVWKSPWFCDLMALIGITETDLISPVETTLIRKLLLPDAAFQINGFCTKSFAAFTHWIGDKITSTNENIDAPYFLTKMNLSSGVINYVNEYELCRNLEKNGFHIVAPEELSFSEQIALFKSKSGICGVLGSNIHTSIFSRFSYGVILNIGNAISDSFYLLDKEVNAHFRYVTSTSIEEVPRQEGFARSFRFSDPIALSDSISNAFFEMKSAITSKFSISSIAPSTENNEIKQEFFKICNKDGKYLCFRRGDGALASLYNSEKYNNLVYPAIATFNKENGKLYIFALSTKPHLVCLTHTLPQSEFVICNLTKHQISNNTVFALYNKHFARWLTLVPDSGNTDAHFSAQEVQGWEHITLEHLPWEKEQQANSRYLELISSMESRLKIK